VRAPFSLSAIAIASTACQDVAAYVALTGRLAQMLKVLGLKREPRGVTPTLQSYLEAMREPNASNQDANASDAKLDN
jgi:hypothetical protein